MLITNQPVPKTIEDLGQEVTDDVVLARLEQQRAVQVGFLLHCALLLLGASCLLLMHAPASCTHTGRGHQVLQGRNPGGGRTKAKSHSQRGVGGGR
jgi:hypothetical protein